MTETLFNQIYGDVLKLKRQMETAPVELATHPDGALVIKKQAAALTNITITGPSSQEIFGLKFVEDPTIPEGEAHFKNSKGEVVGKITGLA